MARLGTIFAKKGPFGVLNSSVAKYQKNNGGQFEVIENFSERNLTMPKKTERGDPMGFFNIHSEPKHQKNCSGGPFVKKKFEKNHNAEEKTGRGDPLVSPGIVWCAKKRNNSFD